MTVVSHLLTVLRWWCCKLKRGLQHLESTTGPVHMVIRSAVLRRVSLQVSACHYESYYESYLYLFGS